jgi:predicted nucleic acid-binding protein
LKVLIDSTVWSLALRRRSADLAPVEFRRVLELRQLARDDRVVMLGLIRQEILSGVKVAAQFDRLKTELSLYADEPVSTEDHVAAAAYFNRCRAGGIAPTSIDMFIAAISARRGWPVMTADRDFERYARVVPLTLYKMRTEV